MERMSTGHLEELLLKDFRTGAEGGDMDSLYQAARVLADRDPCPDAAADRAWESFQANYLPFARKGRSLYEDGATPSSDAATRRRHPSFRLALAGAAAVAVLMSVTAVGTGGGYDAQELRARWTDEKLSMTPGQVVPIERDSLRMPEELEEDAGLRETLLSCGLPVPAAPRWMPEGFEQDSLVVDGESMIESAMFSALYSRGDKKLCIFLLVYFEESGGSSTYQKDAGDPVPYEAGGVTHLLFTNAGRASAVWINGAVEGAISGDISMEDLMKMIDSIYEED